MLSKTTALALIAATTNAANLRTDTSAAKTHSMAEIRAYVDAKALATTDWQSNKWCNTDKTMVTGMKSKSYGGREQCIEQCRGNDACKWVGYRVSDQYCEFWTSGSCNPAHAQPGHDIFDLAADDAAIAAAAAAAAAEAEAEAEAESAASIDNAANQQTVVTSTHITQLQQHLSDIVAAINKEQEDSELAAMALCKRTHDDPTSSKSAPALSSSSAAYAGLEAISPSQVSGCNDGSTCLTKSNAAHTALGTFFYFSTLTISFFFKFFLSIVLF